MTDSRSRNRRKRAAKATRIPPTTRPEPKAIPAPPTPVEPVAARLEADPGGSIAVGLALGGLAFAGFLTVLLMIAASRA